MLTVRELRELAARLDAATFAKQLGPFVLVERPFKKERKSGSLDLTPKTTRPLNGARSSKGVLDFDDLWVATLPPLRDDDEVLIGRTADCDVMLDEGTVSKHHAAIRWKKKHAELEDLGSSNGTLLNGVRAPARQGLRLEDNDAIDFGGVRVLFLEVATLRRRMGLR
ncbi:MAG: FHA domain-containing protein [Myxococcaceae bacterium]